MPPRLARALSMAATLLALPPARLAQELRFRVGSACRKALEKTALYLAADPLGLREPLPAGFLEGFTARAQGRLLPSPRERGPWRSAIAQHYPKFADQLLDEARRIRLHEFDLLGSGPVHLSPGKDHISVYQPIDWHLDPVSGYRWPPDGFCGDLVRAAPRGADIKWPWELSRFQHLTTLGQAYWLTDDETYAEEAAAQFQDWIEHNPPLLGVNWAGPMDVAIRAANWAAGLGYFLDSPAFEPPLVETLVRQLRAHARHVRRHLEWTAGLTANHYLSGIVGLFTVGHLLEGLPEANEWVAFSSRELANQMREQVLPDGLHFEASLPYHRLALELFTLPLILARRNGTRLAADYEPRLRSMYEAVSGYLSPAGLAPQVGDNDDGRLLRFSSRPSLDHSYLVDLGAALFPELKPWTGRSLPDPEVLSWLGAQPTRTARPIGVLSRERLAASDSHAFDHAGLYFWRGGNDVFLVLRCGPIGQGGHGGHAHNDALSLVFSLGAEDFFVDPGSFVYTRDPAARNLFRSTHGHNTLELDGEEQNRLRPGMLFHLRNDARARCLTWKADAESLEFEGEHSGYLRLEEPALHVRRVLGTSTPLRIEVDDEVRTLRGLSTREHDLLWSFHLAPEVAVERTDAVEVRLSRGNRTLTLRETQAQLEPCVEPTGYSPGYGRRVETNVIRFRVRSRLPCRRRFVLEQMP